MGQKKRKWRYHWNIWANFWKNHYEENWRNFWSKSYNKLVHRIFYIPKALANQEAKLAIIDKKLYVQLVTLSAQDNTKQSEQLKSGFIKTINWNRLIDPRFQEIDKLFDWLFENSERRTNHKRFPLRTVEIMSWLMERTLEKILEKLL